MSAASNTVASWRGDAMMASMTAYTARTLRPVTTGARSSRTASSKSSVTVRNGPWSDAIGSAPPPLPLSAPRISRGPSAHATCRHPACKVAVPRASRRRRRSRPRVQVHAAGRGRAAFRPAHACRRLPPGAPRAGADPHPWPGPPPPRRMPLLRSSAPQASAYCGPSVLISAASCSTSAGLRSVSGARTGPASWPTIFAPALTMLTA